MHEPQSYIAGRWVGPGPGASVIHSPVTGQPIARAGGAAPDPSALITHATQVGGPALRAMTIHQRALMVRSLAQYLDAGKEALYALNPLTGATRDDGAVDIDGGILTMRLIASKARREMPDSHVHVEGPVEPLARDGSFVAQHIAVPLQGVAVQINAYNFPVWGMLEKLAPALIAGMPSIIKPATQTSYLAEACFRMIMASGLLPDGAVQLVVGSTGDLLNRMGPQDVVAFTGSADTALRLRQTPAIVGNATRFTAEQDSLNATILGPDCGPDAPEFARFIAQAKAEMTVKAGQKCTAIRRIIVPQAQCDAVAQALAASLATTTIGDPSNDPDMGALVSGAQRSDVLAKASRIAEEATAVPVATAAVPDGPGFLAPQLYLCNDPDAARHVHQTEAFGPVATLVPYRDVAHAAALAGRGGGSLVASLVTADPGVARDVALGCAAWHGRLHISDARTNASPHGAPLPQLVHGGPGRAGGGEELGGIRGVLHHMQRTAIQGSPDHLAAITGQWVPGATPRQGPDHPFQRCFQDLVVGEQITTKARRITLDDIEAFAHFTGDTFYAHMNEAAAQANPFFPGRVAHGYLLLSFAAGLFVQPDPGPVLANTGLTDLRFLKPVSPGDAVHVVLTAQRKTPRTDTYGEVAWHARLLNQDGDPVAEYTLLTMVAFDRP